MKRFAFLIALFALCLLLFAADAKKKDDPWVPMAERVKIWDEVVSNNDK